jgi:hypothetical protein
VGCIAAFVVDYKMVLCKMALQVLHRKAWVPHMPAAAMVRHRLAWVEHHSSASMVQHSYFEMVLHWIDVDFPWEDRRTVEVELHMRALMLAHSWAELVQHMMVLKAQNMKV